MSRIAHNHANSKILSQISLPGQVTFFFEQLEPRNDLGFASDRPPAWEFVLALQSGRGDDNNKQHQSLAVAQMSTKGYASLNCHIEPRKARQSVRNHGLFYHGHTNELMHSAIYLLEEKDRDKK